MYFIFFSLLLKKIIWNLGLNYANIWMYFSGPLWRSFKSISILTPKATCLVCNACLTPIFVPCHISETSAGLQPSFQCIPPHSLSCGVWALQSNPLVLGWSASNARLCPLQIRTSCYLPQVCWTFFSLFAFFLSSTKKWLFISLPHSELIRTADGGQISLDWVDNEASATYPESSTRPTVMMLPGLTGSSQQWYVRHAISQASRRGYRSALQFSSQKTVYLCAKMSWKTATHPVVLPPVKAIVIKFLFLISNLN